MLAHRLPAARIPLIRPLRPPAALHRHPTPRLFTQNSQLLLLASSTIPRPQLPYLAQPFRRHPKTSPYLQGQVLRLLSTENKRFIKEQVYLAAKWTSLFWFAMGLLLVAWFGCNIEYDERTNPTPDEWTWRTRQSLRAARASSDPRVEVRGSPIMDWVKIAASYLWCLTRLEDRESSDGAGVKDVAEGGEEILIPGVGKAGLDISAKSWPWRAGYFDVIMGCALAAEHLDMYVLDTTRGVAFPKDMMVGPSNPDPRPTVGVPAPKEEDCTSPFAAPETFYLRVLTGKGFTIGQRLTAALAYANWLEFKGLNDAAFEMYRWGIDIAKEGLPASVKPEDILDAKSYSLKETASGQVTPNLLRATTSLAIHHARTGNISSALPIFLSVLRARRSAHISPNPPEENEPFNLWNFIFVPPKFPDPPPSGNDPLLRNSMEPTCPESELMLYIGEILFASTKSGKEAEEGIGWTKQAVTIADAQLSKLNPGSPAANLKGAEDEAKKCKECLMTGLGNWEVMVQKLLDHQKTEPVEKDVSAGSSWRFWSRASKTTEDKSVRLKEDRRQIWELRDRIIKEGLANQAVRTNGVTGIWFG